MMRYCSTCLYPAPCGRCEDTDTPSARITVSDDSVACQCCPHTRMSALDRDELLRDMWEYCPTRGCLRDICDVCRGGD